MRHSSDVAHVEEGPIGKTLLRFAVPVLLSQLLQELYNVTDCAVVGRFGGDHALAAAGVAGLVLSVLIKFFIGFSSGISVVTSRLFGAYDFSGLRAVLSSVFRLVICVGALMSLAGIYGAEAMLRLLKSPEEVLPGASVYLRICSAGLAAQLIYNVGSEILRSLGNTRAPMMMYLVSVLCNLVLDVLLVAVYKKGVTGAAVATLASQWLLAGLVLRYLRHMNDSCSLRLRGKGLSGRELTAIVHIGVPAGMQALFMSISSLLIQTQINRFGSEAIAGMSLYAKVEGVLYLPTFAYGIALTGFIGQNMGAGRTDRIRQAVDLSRRTMEAVILPLSFALTALSPVILKLFTADNDILFIAREAILFNLPFYVVYAVNQVYLGAVKGMGDTAYPMVCTLLCYSVFRVLWCRTLMVFFRSMRVVYLSYDVSFFLMLALLLPVYQRMLKKQGLDPRVSSDRRRLDPIVRNGPKPVIK